MTENPARLGLCVPSDRELKQLGNHDGPGPLDLLVLDEGFVEPRREAAARRLGDWIRETLPDTEVMTYAWHLVTHATEDGMRQVGTRRPAGAAHAYGGLQATPEVDQAWDATVRYAVGVGASTIVLRTGASLSPGPVGRRRLREFVDRHRPVEAGFALGWTFEGIWTPDEAARFAQELGLTPVHALRSDRPAAGAWLRIDTRAGRGLDARTLDRVLELAELGDAPALLFAGPGQRKALRQVADELGRTD